MAIPFPFPFPFRYRYYLYLQNGSGSGNGHGMIRAKARIPNPQPSYRDLFCFVRLPDHSEPFERTPLLLLLSVSGLPRPATAMTLQPCEKLLLEYDDHLKRRKTPAKLLGRED